MKAKNINVILIQIDEAHSSAWPKGLKNQVDPQKDFDDRVKRANEFKETDKVPFEILVDTWENDYANKYKSWPDKYYCIDKNKKIIAKSEYTNAIINKDCCLLIEELLNE